MSLSVLLQSVNGLRGTGDRLAKISFRGKKNLENQMIRARNLILTGHMYSFEIEFKSRTNVNARKCLPRQLDSSTSVFLCSLLFPSIFHLVPGTLFTHTQTQNS